MEPKTYLIAGAVAIGAVVLLGGRSRAADPIGTANALAASTNVQLSQIETVNAKINAAITQNAAVLGTQRYLANLSFFRDAGDAVTRAALRKSAADAENVRAANALTLGLKTLTTSLAAEKDRNRTTLLLGGYKWRTDTLQANNAVIIARINSGAAQALARINGGTSIELTRLRTEAQKDIADTAATASEINAALGIVGGVAKAYVGGGLA